MINKITDFTNKHHKYCKIFIFVFSSLLMACLSYIWEGSFVYYNGDSKLYISIADNFLDNGQFLQTHRDQFENFIVPLGYPAILTVIRLFSRSDLLIAIIQYLVFGFSSVLLYCAERNFFGSVGGFAVLMNCLMLWRIHYAAPGCLVTETWYIATVIFCIWLLSRKDISQSKRLTAGFIAAYIGFLIRPVLSIIFFPLAAYMLFLVIKKRFSGKVFAILAGVAALILFGYGFMNYCQTGHFIMTEGYSGISVYLANNDVVAEKGIDFGQSEYSYADDKFYEIFNDESLDYYEKNEIIGNLGKQYMLTHPFITLKNAAAKLWYMFVTYWYGIVAVAALGAFLAIRQRKQFRTEFVLMIIFTLAAAAVTSLGHHEPRYTYIIFPIYTLFTSAAVGIIGKKIISFAEDKAGALLAKRK